MGGKVVFMRRNIQDGIYDSDSGASYSREYTRTRQPDGSYLYIYHKRNRFKVAEGFKLLNLLGSTTFLFGILANLDNLLSVLLGCVGIVWGVVKSLEKYEDYQIKKWERRQRQDAHEEKKKKQKRA